MTNAPQSSPISTGTHQPFTRAMAAEMGISDRRLRSPEFRRVMHGVFVDHRIPDSLPVRTRAALLVAPPGGTASHLTAACLWTANAERSGHIHLSYRFAGTCGRGEIKVHRFGYPIDRSARHGIPVTGPGMTFMHLAVVLDLVKLTAFGDMLVKRKVITPDELMGYARAWSQHGARLGRLAASHVRDRVESVPESNLRMLLVLAGLPEPTVNFPILRPNGEERYRLDLAYPEIMLAIEYDGRWHDEPEQAAKDDLRRTWLRKHGWTVIVIKAEHLYENA
ncbi:MAG: DUF559 domain-containing protein, partial [Actinomycetia bacterium]|nr:DUF559 domain-containing protein [Actinomycetes bacterium]